MPDDLLTARKSLKEICRVPDKIISVYSLEKHVWAHSNSEAARKARKPELRTVEEFQIGPVRAFLNDVLRNMAAPWKRDRKEESIGQGYWIQAEFGSGKSHLLSFLAALALGDKQAWDMVQEKEKKAGRGRRETVYRFWEEGLAAKSGKGNKGVFVIVKTLVGQGGGTVGYSDSGRRLSEYILDAAKEQLQVELGKNVALYPVELLADRFLAKDLDRYRTDLRKFLKDPKYFDEDEFEELDDFVRDIQQNKTPEYKRSCGNKLWKFYTEYLQVQPQIAAETEDVLEHLVETILAEGYSGVLLVLDEVSLFMKNRSEEQRTDDEQTLVVLANRLAKVKNLPIWTICAAQQAIESKMGVKNIIADDRLKLYPLLKDDKDYYDIVLTRVREIVDPAPIGNYYLFYKRGFSWPNAVGEEEFRHFFPFHKPALEVLKAITFELTTARSAIHFMHQVLKHQIQLEGTELIRLWELFDEAVKYEEDPSGVHAGLVAIKTKREDEYRAYEACRRQIDALTKGPLKVYRDKAVKIIQTLFLYHIAKVRQQGLSPEELANDVLIERQEDATVDENIQHYESLTESLKKELRQIVETRDEDNRPRYRFDPVFTGVDPRDEFRKARDEAESNEAMLNEAWDHLLALDEWPVRTRQMTLDLSNGVRSIFRDIAPFVGPWEDRDGAKTGDQTLELVWQGRQISGRIGMRDFPRCAADKVPLPAIDSDQSDLDFAVFVSTKHSDFGVVKKFLDQRKDPRILLWTPAELTHEERERLIDFAAYRKLVSDWQGKDTEDAIAVINWVRNGLETDLAKIKKCVDTSYGRGRIDALDNTQLDFHVAGELSSILTPLVDRVLTSTYESKDLQFDPPFVFRREEGVKVINGIVKTGNIPKGAKPNQNISAAQNFGFGLKIMKKSAEKQLDTSDCPYARDMWTFIDDKLPDDSQAMKVETLYKNFMGIGGPKDYGLMRRMVQIYLLCLVREGKVRVRVGPKAGLPASTIDYSNLASVDFSTKTLDALDELQKVAKPENWEVLRPYAEKILDETIPVTHDDAVISMWRGRLREQFGRGKGEFARLEGKSRSLFEALKLENPYAAEFAQVGKLLSADIEGGDDINRILFALKEAMSYEAFEKSASSQVEVDDLANRLKNYADVKRFVDYESELRTAAAYCAHRIPDQKELDAVRAAQKRLSEKLADVRRFIDSEVRLKTELIGKTPPESGEKGTLGVLIQEYTTAYVAFHDSVVGRVDESKKTIADLISGDEFQALRILEQVPALHPAVSGQIEQELTRVADALFSCPSPSRNSIEEQVARGPLHECGLSFEDGAKHVSQAEQAVEDAKARVLSALTGKVAVLLAPAVRQRLEQGKSEKAIAKILAAKDESQLRDILVRLCREDAALMKTISRFLKKIAVKQVRMSDFKPSIRTVEKGQIPQLTSEFQDYLEQAMKDIEGGDDVLPVLQVE